MQCSEVGKLSRHILVSFQVIIFGIHLISSLDGFDDISFAIRKNILLEDLLFNFPIFDFLFDSLSRVILPSVSLLVFLLLKVALSFIDVFKLVAESSVHVLHVTFQTRESVDHSGFSVKDWSEKLHLIRHVHPFIFKEILKYVVSFPRNDFSKG